MPTKSIGGRRYFVTFIDCTRCCRVYYVRSKSEMFKKVRELELCVTNECGNSIAT